MRGCVTKKNNRYYVVIDLGRDERDRRKRKWHGGYRTKREAEQALSVILASVGDGTYVTPDRRRLGAYMREEWLPAVRESVRSSTWDSYQRNIVLHISPRLGSVPLQKLTTAHVNRFYADLLREGRSDGSGGLSAKTVRYVHTILHKALGDAVAWNLVPRNVASVARVPKVAAAGTSMRTWTSEQLRWFLDGVHDDRMYAAWLVSATTGMRRGEVLGLRWEDVDFERARLSIRQTIVSVAYKVEFSTPKTARGRRSLALDTTTVKALRSHRAQQATERLAWGEAYDDNDLVFPREDGRPTHPDRFTQMFERASASCSLPRIRLHDLRHTYATLSLQAGVHPKVVSERLGHATVAFTLDVYSHAVPAMEEKAAQDVADLIFGTS